jgi:DNA polymerase-3 subunit beta
VEFSCGQKELTKHLGFVVKGVPSRPTNPLLSNILLSVNEETIQIRSFDLTQSIEIEVPAIVGSGCGEAIAVPANLFNDVISKMPSGELKLFRSSHDEFGVALCIVYKRSKCFIPIVDANHFPSFPPISDNSVLVLSALCFYTCLLNIHSFVGSDDSNPILSGVNISCNGAGTDIRLLSTDEFRLALTTMPNIDNIASFSCTVPARAIADLQAKLSSEYKSKRKAVPKISDDLIYLGINESQICFKLGSYTLNSLLLSGRYPELPHVFNRQPQFVYSLQTKQADILEILERVAVCSEASNSIVMVSFDYENGQLHFNCRSYSYGESFDSIDFSVSNQSSDWHYRPDTSITHLSFVIRHLIEGIKSIDTIDSIQINIMGHGLPIMLDSPDNSPIRISHYIMPVQVFN